jgi:hypothetical protein
MHNFFSIQIQGELLKRAAGEYCTDGGIPLGRPGSATPGVSKGKQKSWSNSANGHYLILDNRRRSHRPEEDKILLASISRHGSKGITIHGPSCDVFIKLQCLSNNVGLTAGRNQDLQ